jgi:hypothetical protein
MSGLLPRKNFAPAEGTAGAKTRQREGMIAARVARPMRGVGRE